MDEGIIKDENSLLEPYGITLEQAFKNNRDSCFILVSKAIGDKRKKNCLVKINYGNKSIQGEKDRFWINGFLQITPAPQLDFICKFYQETMPFSKYAYEVVKHLMHENAVHPDNVYGKRGSNKLYEKGRFTGNLYAKAKYTGWYVGYIQTGKDVCYFVNYLESPDLHNPFIVEAQKNILFRLLGITIDKK